MTSLGTATAITDDDYNAMDPFLRIIAQDANGVDTYSNEKAMVGHLEAKYNLILDQHTDDYYVADNAITVDLKALGKKDGITQFIGNGAAAAAHKASHSYISRYAGGTESLARKIWILKLTALNYAGLREAEIGSKTAFLMAALRARWVALGCYSVTKQDTSAEYNEVTVVNGTDRFYGPLVTATTAKAIVANLGKYSADFQTEFQSEKHGMKYVTKHAENFWAASESAFRVRNHHFKNLKDFIASYTSLYLRFLDSAYEGNFTWPDGIDMYDVFRLAIHPFKLKALPIMMAHFVAYGKIANAAITRASGSPCGCATITTTVAALDTMKAEPWWESFSKVYGKTIDEAIDYAEQINDDKFSYHMSAGLYGMAKKTTVTHKGKTVTIEEAKSRISLLASACQGMINALEVAVKNNLIKKFALANARALEKPAAANPLLSARVTMLVTAAMNMIEDAEDMATAITNALPTLKSDKDSAKEEGKSGAA